MTPYYDQGGVQLYVGHVLDMLATLPERSVQTCVTSPPYWGLRAYGTDPQVWGGTADCEHAWSVTASPAKSGGHGAASGKQVSNAGSQHGNYPEPFRNGKLYMDHQLDSQVGGGAVCVRCNAWRGELGSEPTPEQFVANIVAVFRAVWRVLRDDGTTFLNLGDSYAGSGKGPTGASSMLNGGRGVGDDEKVVQRHNALQEQRQGFVGGVDRVAAIVPPGLKPKDLVGIPWRCAFALQAEGWYLRSAITWCKKSAMPESVRDRPTSATEMIFLLAKQERYFYDAAAVRQPVAETSRERLMQPTWAEQQGSTRANGGAKTNGPMKAVGTVDGANLRNYWLLGPEPLRDEHYAAYPSEIPRRAILAGSRVGDTVLDPFTGSGTSGLVASRLNRRFVGIELNPEYAAMASRRIVSDAPLLQAIEPDSEMDAWQQLEFGA